MPIYEYQCPICHTRFEKLLLYTLSQKDDRIHQEYPCIHENCSGQAQKVPSVYSSQGLDHNVGDY